MRGTHPIHILYILGLSWNQFMVLMLAFQEGKISLELVPPSSYPMYYFFASKIPSHKEVVS